MPTHEELVKGAAKISPEQAHNAANPKVFFDIKIGDPHAGRVTFEVGANMFKSLVTLLFLSIACFLPDLLHGSFAVRSVSYRD